MVSGSEAGRLPRLATFCTRPPMLTPESCLVEPDLPLLFLDMPEVVVGVVVADVADVAARMNGCGTT